MAIITCKSGLRSDRKLVDVDVDVEDNEGTSTNRNKKSLNSFYFIY